MRKQLKLRWTTRVTTTAGHKATALMPCDQFTRSFINKHISIPAGCYGFDPSYLQREAFMNQPILIKGGV